MIGRFFGSSPKLVVIQSIVDKLWGEAGKIDVIPLDGNGFLFKFRDPATTYGFFWGGGSVVYC